MPSSSNSTALYKSSHVNVSSIAFNVPLITDTVFNPKKSYLTPLHSSTCGPVYRVTLTPVSLSTLVGNKSLIGIGVTRIPEACTPKFLFVPSNLLANLNNSGLLCSNCLNSLYLFISVSSNLSKSLNLILGASSVNSVIFLDIAFIVAKSIFNTLPTSLSPLLTPISV